jgi:hypothetical protein
MRIEIHALATVVSNTKDKLGTRAFISVVSVPEFLVNTGTRYMNLQQSRVSMEVTVIVTQFRISG